MLERSELIREYVTALRQNNASIFLGAGMSMSVFNTNWHDLMKPYASSIKLSLKKDGNDFPLIAQAYIDAGNDILEFKRSIGEKFQSDEVDDFHKAIAGLPIQNYWTTNYDSLIENALTKSDKHFDMIYDNHSFGALEDKRDHVVYKFHGDWKNPKSIVVTQKDYDDYLEYSNNFVSALNKELVSSSILFLGYSFNDPNIKNIIATLTAKNGECGNHFMITKRKRCRSAKEQKIWLKNLERYGINTLLIDNYNDVKKIIKEIEQQYMSYKILFSGSAVDYSQFASEESAQDFIHDLGYELVRWDCSGTKVGHGLEVISGNGLGVGKFLSEGMSEATADYGLDIADYFKSYPFPKVYYEQFEKEKTIEEKYYDYRNKMVAKCGIVFFIFGNKLNPDGKVVNADGVRKEFNIAVQQKKYVFPIGATGYMAKELADLVLSDFKRYNGDMPNIEKILRRLNNHDVSPQDIISGIKQIVDILAFRPECK